ncbi:MAG TPA: DMT family transporter [Allosphingosinicella sp.]
MQQRQHKLLGIGLRLAATSCFGLMAALIKLGHEAGVHVVELVFYRFAFGLPPLLLWIFWSRNFAAWRTERPLAHLWRSALGLSAMGLSFTALGYLPLAEATTIGFAAPLFAVLLSALLFKEQVGLHRWSAVVAGFAGVLLVMQPGNNQLPMMGLSLAVLSALAVGGVTVTVREIGKTEGTQTTVLWFTAIAILATGLLMPFVATTHDLQTWMILASLGLVGGLAQLFHTAALRFAPVPVLAPFDYSQLLWAVLLGWLIWDTHAPASTWAGAAVIIASGLYTVYREHRLGRDKPKTAPPL